MKYNFKRAFLIVLLSIFYSLQTHSQTKNEVEKRIDKSEFPELALKYLQNLPDNYKRLKFFIETDATKVSYEAKLKYKKRYYSIEFDKNGILEDIEITIKKRHLPKPLLEKINASLKEIYDKYRFLKIQKQYKNTSENNSISVLNNAFQNDNVNTIYFEIIAEVTLNKKRDLKEFTFDKNGKLISTKVVVPESYEHVLY